jgi:hypothetical protein
MEVFAMKMLRPILFVLLCLATVAIWLALYYFLILSPSIAEGRAAHSGARLIVLLIALASVVGVLCGTLISRRWMQRGARTRTRLRSAVISGLTALITDSIIGYFLGGFLYGWSNIGGGDMAGIGAGCGIAIFVAAPTGLVFGALSLYSLHRTPGIDS